MASPLLAALSSVQRIGFVEMERFDLSTSSMISTMSRLRNAPQTCEGVALLMFATNLSGKGRSLFNK